MDQNTHTAPFNLGDHLCYVGSSQWRAPPAGPKRNPELVLTRGMVGVVILSSGDLVGEEALSQPWRCQVQFRNGLQRDITPHNHADFLVPQRANRRQSSHLTAPGPEPAPEPNQPQGEPGNVPEREPGNHWVTPEAELPLKRSDGTTAEPDTRPSRSRSAEDGTRRFRRQS
jgi:hypothetical protein